MNKLLVLALGAVVVLPLAGCSCMQNNSSPLAGGDQCSPIPPCVMGCTMTEDPRDHSKRVARNMNLDLRQAVEDFDYLMLWDEPSHLTGYYMPHAPSR